MRIYARDLAVGDVFQVNDWRLHVIAVERDTAAAVLTAEFEFLLHFTSDDLVDVQEPRAMREAPPARLPAGLSAAAAAGR